MADEDGKVLLRTFNKFPNDKVTDMPDVLVSAIKKLVKMNFSTLVFHCIYSCKLAITFAKSYIYTNFCLFGKEDYYVQTFILTGTNYY